MKRSIRLFLAAVLCAAAFLGVLAAPAAAFGEYYSTVAKVPEKKNEYAALQSPSNSRLFTRRGASIKRAEVKSSWAGGGIYFMPKPTEGFGALGTVETGTPVTIFAEADNLYFFMTDDGRMGWNGKWFFTNVTDLPEDDAAALSEGSALTVADALAVSKFLENRYVGASSWSFHAERPVVIIENGGTAELSIQGMAQRTRYSVDAVDGSSAEAEWVGDGIVNGYGVVKFTAKEPGATIFKVNANRYLTPFHVLVLVV